MKKALKKLAILLSVVVLGTILAYSGMYARNGLQAQPGDKMTSAKWNELVSKVSGIFTDSNGNVGIGTESPNGNLHIKRNSPSSDTKFIIENSDTTHGNSTATWYKNPTGTWLSGIWGPGSGWGAGSFNIFNTSNSLPSINIQSSGTVGIGKIGTWGALDVNGAINTYDVLLNGSNTWLIHSPDDGRETLYFGKGSNGSISSWPIYFMSSGLGVSSAGWTTSSDKRLKTNIKESTLGLDIILKLKPKTFDWKDGRKNDFGFIAQEVEEILPKIVATGETGYKSVDYAKFTPILTKSIQELKAENDNLKKDNQILKSQSFEILERLEKLEQK